MIDHKKIPKELDAMVDIVLAYRPKPKSKPAKKRKRMAKKLVKLAAKASAEARQQK